MEKICQSCAMPLKTKENFGTKTDGSPCEEFCCYCYQKGAFTAPHITLEEMIVKLTNMHDKFNKTKEQAQKWASETLPTLKRWKKGGCKCCCKGH
jgi:hypothetical protein